MPGEGVAARTSWPTLGARGAAGQGEWAIRASEASWRRTEQGSTRRFMRAVIAFLVGSFALAGTADADNWPQWRGPRGTGIAQEEVLPTRWSSEDNIVWKAPLRGLGVSTDLIREDDPVVPDDRRAPAQTGCMSSTTTPLSRFSPRSTPPPARRSGGLAALLATPRVRSPAFVEWRISFPAVLCGEIY